MAAHNTCALLIGSGKYEARDACHGEKTAVKKGGIRKKLSKDGRPIPDGQWADGDIGNMERLLTSKGVDVSRFNYTEQHKDTYEYARGKCDVLEEIARFFERADKTYFILYYTGHANGNGSWCFPVTRRLVKKTSSLHSSHSQQPEAQEQCSGVESQGDEVAKLEVTVEVYAQPGVAGDTTQQIETATGLAPQIETATGLAPLGAEESDGTIRDDVVEKSRVEHGPERGTPVLKSTSQEISNWESSEFSILEPPDPAKKWNDYVTFEEVIKKWEEKREGRQNRYLMIILDCCHAGRWVEMINDLNKKGENDGDNGTKRPDICIQAACRALEGCNVASNQESSVFTRAFVAAQNTSFFEKLALSVIDHAFVLNVVSIFRSRQAGSCSPISSQFAPFAGIKFFDSFDDMYLKT